MDLGRQRSDGRMSDLAAPRGSRSAGTHLVDAGSREMGLEFLPEAALNQTACKYPSRAKMLIFPHSWSTYPILPEEKPG